MVYTTSKHTSNEGQTRGLQSSRWPITFLPINGHQARCPAMWVSKQKDDQATGASASAKSVPAT